MAAELLDRMSRLVRGPGLLVVSGASGVGKTSLLRAGVLPRIRGAGLAGEPGSAASAACPDVHPGPRAPLDELGGAGHGAAHPEGTRRNCGESSWTTRPGLLPLSAWQS